MVLNVVVSMFFYPFLTQVYPPLEYGGFQFLYHDPYTVGPGTPRLFVQKNKRKALLSIFLSSMLASMMTMFAFHVNHLRRLCIGG